MNTIEVQCGDCDGTGLYSGMCEPKGTAVVCLRCDGSGCSKLRYIPFNGRKIKSGIQHVYRSGGKFLVGPMGPKGNAITYEEFKAGKLPAKIGQ